MTTEPYPLERLFGRIRTPFEEFLRRTTAGGIVLMTTALIALALATILGEQAMVDFWQRTFALRGEAIQVAMSWQHWVNDGLMALFFLLVGLELKREILVGELSSLKDAILPVAAALGGMVVPALIYHYLNAGTPAARGWGIPMATDIAFAVGILVLLAWRIPRNLVIFLTALAIADDLGAVLVIALFYTSDIDVPALWTAVAIMLVLVLFNRAGIRHPLPYGLVGILLWHELHLSGIHATLAGIALAAAIPVRAAFSPLDFDRRIAELQNAFRADLEDAHTSDDPLSNYRMAAIAENMERSAISVQSPLQRMEHALTPWVTFVVIPIFALANAGIDLTSVRWAETISSPVTIGIVCGLVLGKFTGITLFSYAAVSLGLARLPAGVRWPEVMGAAWLGGIGFTMSLFVAQLAFREAAMVEQAKVGILLASSISAVIGLVWLFFASARRARNATPAQP